MNWHEALNRFFDALPRPVLSRFGRPVPTFRTCGIAGYYVALLVLMGCGLLTGRSLTVLAMLAAVSGLSFFAYTYLRMWISGREVLVLLEHVWFALACNAGFLWLLGQPVLGYLDVVSVGLCPFLAAGRIGCTLVGCCHGRPSALGISYTEACAREGFATHLVGIRLFPVQPLEALGLLAVGITGGVALPFAGPGRVFSWYLIAYAVMRFGLEGLRGDRRPHWLGLSQARWMAIAEVALALSLSGGGFSVPVAVVAASLVAGLVLVLAIRWKSDPDRLLLASAHTQELRDLVSEAIERPALAPDSGTVSCTTSRHVRAVASPGTRPQPGAIHVSLSLGSKNSDLLLLCHLAARAFPGLRPSEARFGATRVLHFLLAQPLTAPDGDSRAARARAEALYGAVVRPLQLQERSPLPLIAGPSAHVSQPTRPLAREHEPDGPEPSTDATAARWYFGAGSHSPEV